ncbi:MAG: hypothetical protein JWP12_835 [Bacteroidetes bacterium]|nr:hypothetical protein [Bacteroidota bacterium]
MLKYLCQCCCLSVFTRRRQAPPSDVHFFVTRRSLAPTAFCKHQNPTLQYHPGDFHFSGTKIKIRFYPLHPRSITHSPDSYRDVIFVPVPARIVQAGVIRTL